MNQPDLALNNQQWLICHKTTPNQNWKYIFVYFFHHRNLFDFSTFFKFQEFTILFRIKVSQPAPSALDQRIAPMSLSRNQNVFLSSGCI